ncbi:MAG: hypothetical protein ABIH49_03350 [archaeon]
MKISPKLKFGSYTQEGISPEDAQTGFLSDPDNETKRRAVLRPCFDIYTEYSLNGRVGVLLAYRDAMPPAANQIWGFGGEWKRGYSFEEALRMNLKRETGLDVAGEPELLSIDTFLFKDTPYDDSPENKEIVIRNLGRGIHDLAFTCFTQARGVLDLNTLVNPLIVTRENYQQVMEQSNAHPHVRESTLKSLQIIQLLGRN